MDKKYIVVKAPENTVTTEIAGQELIFTFPPQINHSRMLEVVGLLRFGKGQWVRDLTAPECVAAGFVDSKGVCYGESISLDKMARPIEDTALLAQHQTAPAISQMAEMNVLAILDYIRYRASRYETAGPLNEMLEKLTPGEILASLKG